MMVETIIIPQKLVFHRYPDTNTDTLLKIHTTTNTKNRVNQVDQNLVTVVGGGVGGCGTIIVSTPEVIKLVAQPS